jgi:hypothetical protein
MPILPFPCILRLPPVPTSKAKRPTRPPERTIRLIHPIEGTMPGHVVITVDKVSKDYTLERFESPLGDAFRLTKCSPVEDGEESVYHILLSREGHSCECLGFLHHDHCRHIAGLIALVNAGYV